MTGEDEELVHSNYDNWFYKSPSHIKSVKEDPDFQPADEGLARSTRHAAGPFPDAIRPRVLNVHERADLAKCGPGVQLYFSLIKDIGFLFILLGLIKLPQTIISMTGSMLRLNHVNKSLLGNVGEDPEIYSSDSTEIADSLVNRTVWIAGDRRVSLQNIMIAFGILDVVCTLIVNLFMIYFVRLKTPRVCALNDQLVYSLADHSIMVRRLPGNIGINQPEYSALLREHFTRLLAPLLQGGWHENGEVIRELIIVNDSCAELPKLVKLGTLKHELALLEARRLHGARVSARKMQRKLQKIENLTSEIIADDAELATKEEQVCVAFVVFDTPAHRDYILGQYAASVSTWAQAQQPLDLRFFGHHLRVEPAPEPEDIIWEHLYFPRHTRARNVVVIWLVVLVILVMVFFLCSMLHVLGDMPPNTSASSATTWSVEFDTNDISQDLGYLVCDFELFSDLACTTRVTPTNIHAMPFKDTTTMAPLMEPRPGCSDAAFMLTADGRGAPQFGIEATFASPLPVNCVTFTHAFFDEAAKLEVSSDTIVTASVAACEYMRGETSTHRFCTMTRTSKLEPTVDRTQWSLVTWSQDTTEFCSDIDLGWQTWDDLTDADVANMESMNNGKWYLGCLCLDDWTFDRIHICRSYYFDYVVRQVFDWLVLILISLVNTVMKKLVRLLVWKLEKPASYTQFMALNLSKTFFANFLNSGFMILLTHAALFPHVLYIRGKQLTGEYGDLSPSWYVAAGTKLISFALLHAFFPRLLSPFKIGLRWLWRWIRKSHHKVQEDLDRSYRKREFGIDSKLAGAMAFASFCLVYIGPIPLLPFVGAAAMLVTYWTDKAELVYDCKNPPFFSAAVSNVALGLLEVGILVKLIVSLYAYGHPLVASACTVNHHENQLLASIVNAAHQEGIQLTYEYVPKDSSFADPDWVHPRAQAFFSSCGGFPTVLYLAVTLLVILLAIIGSAIVIGVRKPWGYKLGAKMMESLRYRVEEHTETGKFDELVMQLKSRGLISSYEMTANPAYEMVTRAQNQLQSRLATKPSSPTRATSREADESESYFRDDTSP